MEPFKNWVNEAVVKQLAEQVGRALPSLNKAKLVKEGVDGLEALELLDRGRHLANVLLKHLPEDPAEALTVLTKSMGAKLGVEQDFGSSIWVYLPYSEVIFRLGPRAIREGLKANYELTQRYTAEWSLRGMLLKVPEPTLTELMKWTKDASAHVRRTVSESTRTRLPWSVRLPAYMEDPSPVLALLEQLKDDESEYVRRSVGNNLNDIAKDNPAVVLKLARAWLKNASVPRQRIVARGLRSLVKQAHPEALALMGADGKFTTKGSVAPKRLKLGERVALTVTVTNAGKTKGQALIDLRLHFAGMKSPKVFKLAKAVLQSGETGKFVKNFEVQHRSIRRLNEGRHRVEAQVNGQIIPIGHFDLLR